MFISLLFSMLSRNEYVDQAHVGEITITVVLRARHLDSKSIIQVNESGRTMQKRKLSMFYANLQHNNWLLSLFMAPISFPSSFNSNLKHFGTVCSCSSSA